MTLPSSASVYSPNFFLRPSNSPHFFLHLSVPPSFFPLPKYTPPIFGISNCPSPIHLALWSNLSPLLSRCVCNLPQLKDYKSPPPKFDVSNSPSTRIQTPEVLTSPHSWFFMNFFASPKIIILKYTLSKNDELHLSSPIFGENHFSSPHFMSTPPRDIFGVFPKYNNCDSHSST